MKCCSERRISHSFVDLSGVLLLAGMAQGLAVPPGRHAEHLAFNGAGIVGQPFRLLVVWPIDGPPYPCAIPARSFLFQVELPGV